MKIDLEKAAWIAGGILGAVGIGYAIKDPMLALVNPRYRVSDLMNAVLPCKYPDESFQAITGGKFAPGFGSSCGFLPSYLWSQLGVTNCTILNRSEGACIYTPGANMSRIVGGGHALNCWIDDLTADPRCGDVIFCSNGPPSSEHVFVFDRVEGDQWYGWDGGHPSADAMSTSRRTFNGLELEFIGGPRHVRGWVDLELLLKNQ